MDARIFWTTAQARANGASGFFPKQRKPGSHYIVRYYSEETGEVERVLRTFGLLGDRDSGVTKQAFDNARGCALFIIEKEEGR